MKQQIGRGLKAMGAKSINRPGDMFNSFRRSLLAQPKKRILPRMNNAKPPKITFLKGKKKKTKKKMMCKKHGKTMCKMCGK